MAELTSPDWVFHFSDDPSIRRFEPRPVRTPVNRPNGWDWLNGPLVWAVAGAYDVLYLFPRECPRILIWPTPAATAEDVAHWFPCDDRPRAIAFIEREWETRLRRSDIVRYRLPARDFEWAGELGYHVSRFAVEPDEVGRLTDLPRELAERQVELRIMDDLTPLKGLWDTSLHVSGVRLRNARGWGPPGWPHTPPVPGDAP